MRKLLIGILYYTFHLVCIHVNACIHYYVDPLSLTLHHGMEKLYQAHALCLVFKVVFQSIQNWFKGVAHVFVMKILMANIEEVLFCIDMTISYFVCQFGFLFSFSLLYVQYFKKK